MDFKVGQTFTKYEDGDVVEGNFVATIKQPDGDLYTQVQALTIKELIEQMIEYDKGITQ